MGRNEHREEEVVAVSQGTGAQAPTRQGFHWQDGFGPTCTVAESSPRRYFGDTGLLVSRELPFSAGHPTARERCALG